jgi:hypothetical protein
MSWSLPTTYASNAVTGYGAEFAIGPNASPFVPTYILEIKSIKVTNFSVSEVDVTHLLSPDATEESIPGLIKPGTIEIAGNFLADATQFDIPTSAIPASENSTLLMYQIKANIQRGAFTYYNSGLCYVTKWEVGPFEINKPVEFMGSFKISGVSTESGGSTTPD